jgi:hypothetical protein
MGNHIPKSKQATNDVKDGNIQKDIPTIPSRIVNKALFFVARNNILDTQTLVKLYMTGEVFTKAVAAQLIQQATKELTQAILTGDMATVLELYNSLKKYKLNSSVTDYEDSNSTILDTEITGENLSGNKVKSTYFLEEFTQKLKKLDKSEWCRILTIDDFRVIDKYAKHPDLLVDIINALPLNEKIKIFQSRRNREHDPVLVLFNSHPKHLEKAISGLPQDILGDIVFDNPESVVVDIDGNPEIYTVTPIICHFLSNFGALRVLLHKLDEEYLVQCLKRTYEKYEDYYTTFFSDFCHSPIRLKILSENLSEKSLKILIKNELSLIQEGNKKGSDAFDRLQSLLESIERHISKVEIIKNARFIAVGKSIKTNLFFSQTVPKGVGLQATIAALTGDPKYHEEDDAYQLAVSNLKRN